jgi:beta-barrel assembly-enhancing protease
MKNTIRLNVLAAAVVGICAAVALPVSAFDLGGLIDKKTLDQTARDKLGIKSDAANPAEAVIPLTGNPTDADEEKLGREIAGRLLGAAPLVNDAKLQQYVNKVGRYVAAQSGRPDLDWTFGVIETSSVNAFAAPGGYVFITRGLYAGLKSEAELAGVLGHEIGHVNARHHVRLLQKQRVLAMGQDFLKKKAGDNNTVQALVGNGAEILSRSLDKESEFEADRLGVYYATKSGYDAYGLPAALDRLNAAGDSDAVSMLYKTHPLPADRLAALDVAMGTQYDKVKPGLTLEKRLVKLPPAPVVKVAPAAAATGATPATAEPAKK